MGWKELYDGTYKIYSTVFVKAQLLQIVQHAYSMNRNCINIEVSPVCKILKYAVLDLIRYYNSTGMVIYLK